jgi:putative transposase
MEIRMKRNRFTVEQIIRMLREAEVHLSHGKSVKLVSRELGITEQTYYRWRKEYGGMKVSQARRLKELEQENARLKRAVADLTLDKLILREALEGNY